MDSNNSKLPSTPKELNQWLRAQFGDSIRSAKPTSPESTSPSTKERTLEVTFLPVLPPIKKQPMKDQSNLPGMIKELGDRLSAEQQQLLLSEKAPAPAKFVVSTMLTTDMTYEEAVSTILETI